LKRHDQSCVSAGGRASSFVSLQEQEQGQELGQGPEQEQEQEQGLVLQS
jgi:hypothetical protein